ncbi:MAG TPA: aspartate/glutamate racemase family protein [Candidatus Limnocylindrales bacterium]|nr:aspartate/glutamate racemase family protein [Candidatus Limnocylindrales bacterium]
MAATRPGGEPLTPLPLTPPAPLTPPKRLGILTPSSNTVLEPLSIALAAPIAQDVTLHFARFRVTRIAEDGASDDQFASDPMLDAAGLLADARVDGILWSGTSGAWLGLDVDHRLVDAIREATGIEATTSTLALLDAFAGLGVRRYALVVPYVAAVTEAIVANLGALGYECVARTNEDLVDNWSFATVTSDTLAERVRTVAAERPDAIVIHCTNLRGAEVSERLEQELGIPVLDSVVVGLWGALRQLDVAVPRTGFGRLSAVERAEAPERARAGANA